MPNPYFVIPAQAGTQTGPMLPEEFVFGGLGPGLRRDDGRCSVEQARGRDGEDGGEFLEDADAGIAPGPLKIAQIDLGHSGFEGDILLRPLSFGAKHPQVSREPVTDVHAAIAPRNGPQCDH